MRTHKRYRLDRIAVAPATSRPASWTFAGDAVRGTEHTYLVTDNNFPARNTWEFLVRVPEDPRGRIEVRPRSEEHTSELQSRLHLVCRLLLEKKKQHRP